MAKTSKPLWSVSDEDSQRYMIQRLVERLCEFVAGNFASSLKKMSVNVLLLLATIDDLIDRNLVFELFMVMRVFETLCQILAVPDLCLEYGQQSVILLMLLVNYRKYEKAINPALVKLSILDDELALKGYSLVIAATLAECNRNYRDRINQTTSSGVVSSFTNIVANLFVPPDEQVSSISTNEGLLMAMYDAVHLNRNFITFLTNLHAQTDGASPVVQPSANTATPQTEDGRPIAHATPILDCPTNLLVEFLTHCSGLMQYYKGSDQSDSDPKLNAVKLCAIALTCITEDQYAQGLMHDVNMTFRVPLFRAPMRHRKRGLEKQTECRPLACAVMDLCVEFMMSHLTKRICMDMYLIARDLDILWTLPYTYTVTYTYSRCLGIIHRIICYEKRCRVRLKYTWRDLVNALASVTKYIVFRDAPDDVLPSFVMLQKICTILNLFITYGDTFLPEASTYDELYYEIVRNWDTFEAAYTFALRYTHGNGVVTAESEQALRLCHYMTNLKAVYEHFNPRIQSAAGDGIQSLTEPEILAVIRDNYDSLKLKLLENLDVYQRYNEQPQESQFFRHTLMRIVRSARQEVYECKIDHGKASKEFNLLKEKSMDTSSNELTK